MATRAPDRYGSSIREWLDELLTGPPLCRGWPNDAHPRASAANETDYLPFAAPSFALVCLGFFGVFAFLSIR